MKVRAVGWLVLTAASLAGCARDEEPLGPVAGEVGAHTSIVCQADIRTGTLSCGSEEPLGAGGSRALIGGQGKYVYLESTDVKYDAGAAVFSAQIALRNYLSQPLGTADGAVADPDGVRIFFAGGPVVTAGSGGVAVKNADGVDDFTGTGQPYFRYAGLLAPGQSSAGKVWEWSVAPTVEAFTFVVGVSATVPAEDDLVPGIALEAKSLAVGHEFACALDQGGKAYCWGSNANGRLGIGVGGDRGTPTPVAGGLTFTAISAGESHACAITPTNDAYCWGAGGSYQLGTGRTDDEYSPVAVGGGVKFKTIRAGMALTCGLSLENDIYCWGSNANGRTGQGTTSGNTTVPTKINGSYKYKWVSAGYYQACAITTDDVAVCWGNGNLGRSGDGITTSHTLLTPTPILSSEKFATIETGSAYTCALTLAGDAYCFGVGGNGQTGAGVIDTTGTPRKVLGEHEFTTISVRYAHTCATKANGEAWCWGSNDRGRLGTGDTESSRVPVRVRTDQEFDFVGVGRYHTCGLTRSGKVYCWGRGDNASQLGIGVSANRYAPVPVSTVRLTVAELRPHTRTDTSAIFGEALATSVRVESAGLAASGVAVRFSVVSGAGTVNDTLVTSDANGIATVLWQPGAVVGVQRLCASIADAAVEFTANVTAPVPGTSYFGRNEYVEYIPGELPIILSSPHAGTLTPSEIPNRTWGTTVRDGELHDVTLRTAAALQELTGKRPHVILMHLRRTKVDANREIVEAAQGNVYAERAWHEYHGWIETAREIARQSYNRGFYIDMHGHGHTKQRLELGYLLTAAELRLNDAQLGQAQYVNKSSIRTLATTGSAGFVELLKGETSFGQMLARRGYAAVPSKSDPAPLSGDPYFNGGYSTVRHGSRDGGVIDGVQIEHNSSGVRNSASNRAAYSRALAEAILEYLETHMGLRLKK